MWYYQRDLFNSYWEHGLGKTEHSENHNAVRLHGLSYWQDAQYEWQLLRDNNKNKLFRDHWECSQITSQPFLSAQLRNSIRAMIQSRGFNGEILKEETYIVFFQSMRLAHSSTENNTECSYCK